MLADFYTHFIVMKTFHFQTKSGFRHTKVDEYISAYLDNFDRFMEVYQGANKETVKDTRIKIETVFANDKTIAMEIENMLTVIVDYRNVSPSLDSVLDLMQADLQKLMYLITFE